MLTKIKSWTVETWLVIIVIGLGVGLKLTKLTTVPLFLQEDELVYALNARFIWLSGHDLTGTWSPASLTPIEAWFDELTAPILAPFLGLPFGNLLDTRLATTLLSAILVIVIGLLIYELTKSRRAGWLGACLSLLNPWLFQISRTSFDNFFSFFFYTLGGWLYLKLPRWQKLWSLPVFALGFYQYQGYKLILLPWILILTIFLLWPERKKLFRRRQFTTWLMPIVGLVFAASLTLFYAKVQLPQQAAASRAVNILTPSHHLITDQLQVLTDETLPNPWYRLMVSPYFIWVKTVANRYFNLYSLSTLFWQVGEAGVNTYWLWYFGSFYLIDILLIGLGFYSLGQQKNWRLFTFLILFLLIAPLPALLNAQGDGQWWLHRGSFRVLPLLILASIGASFIWRKLRTAGKIIFTSLYLLGFIYFAALYFYRLPLTSALTARYAPRIVSAYVGRASKNRAVTIYVNGGRRTYFDNYLFYNNVPNRDNVTQIQTTYRDYRDQKTYQVGQVTFTDNCLDQAILQKNTDRTLVIDATIPFCENENQSELNRGWLVDQTKTAGLSLLAIQSPKVHADIFYIIGDVVCNRQDVSNDLGVITLTDLALDHLTDQQFCEKLLVRF